jgi:predicted Rossmann fold flavoprotein
LAEILSEKAFDVIVIGAGAAGLIAAGRAAELGAQVLLLEKKERPGRKLLITGKGRCNLTNIAPMSDFFQHIHPKGKFLKNAFSSFFSDDIIQLLKKNGLETLTERGGRVFPDTGQSADVVNALLRWIRKNNVTIECNRTVKNLLVSNEIVNGIVMQTETGPSEIRAGKVILCTGGKSYPATGSEGDGYRIAAAAGHTIEGPRPALVPLETEGDRAQRLQGLSLKNIRASVWVNGKKQKDEFGEMLFTHFGLTGPVILTLSGFVVDELIRKNSVDISVDLKPALDEQKLDARLLRDLDGNGKRKIDNIFRMWLPASLIPVFLDDLGIDGSKEAHQMTGKERHRILLLMKDLRFRISGYRPFREAIITAGGIVTDETDSKTMESKLVKNLYFAGEVLDLDADTGGYNLQIAFSTGWLAATSCMAENLKG